MERNMNFLAVKQPDNPNDIERQEMAKLALAEKGRLDDFTYITNLLSPPPDITSLGQVGVGKGIRVGIIGGGLAGMAAAFELRKLGFDITIFEALEDRLGGRVYTHYFNRGKTIYAEFGPMRIPVTHETTWHYINLFGLKTRPFIQVNPNGLIYLKNVRVKNDPTGQGVMNYIYPKYNLAPWERLLPWQQLANHGLEGPLLQATPENRSEIIQIKPKYSNDTLYWDANTARRVLEDTGLSNSAIDLIGNFYPLVGQNLYNSFIDYIEEIYSADLDYLYEIPGGIVHLPLMFYHSFQQKDPKEGYQGIPQDALGTVLWKDGHWVEAISHTSSGDQVVLAVNSKKNHRYYETFDYVVCAIPFSTLRNVEIKPLFSNTKMQAIREVNYINAQKTFFACRERFWERGGPNQRILGGASYTDLPISIIFYPSDHADLPANEPLASERAKEPGSLLASYNFHMEATRLVKMPDKMSVHQIKRQVEQVHGLPKGYLDSVVYDSKTVNWNDEPWFRGALCFYTPEQKQLFSVASVSPEYGNRVFFAGEHVSTKHRWMQGALQSGMVAANGVASACRVQKY